MREPRMDAYTGCLVSGYCTPTHTAILTKARDAFFAAVLVAVMRYLGDCVPVVLSDAHDGNVSRLELWYARQVLYIVVGMAVRVA